VVLARHLVTTGGVKRGAKKGANEGVEVTHLARADLWPKGGSHKEWMVAERDRLADSEAVSGIETLSM
jgi:hypothetical protein